MLAQADLGCQKKADVVARHGVEGSEKTTVYARHLPPSREMAINLQTFGSED